MSWIIDHLKLHKFKPCGVKARSDWHQDLSKNIEPIDFEYVKGKGLLDKQGVHKLFTKVPTLIGACEYLKIYQLK